MVAHFTNSVRAIGDVNLRKNGLIPVKHRNNSPVIVEETEFAFAPPKREVIDSKPDLIRFGEEIYVPRERQAHKTFATEIFPMKGTVQQISFIRQEDYTPNVALYNIERVSYNVLVMTREGTIILYEWEVGMSFNSFRTAPGT